MAVEPFPITRPATSTPIPGLTIGIAMAGIRKANRRDLTVVVLEPGASVAGVFTRNRFFAAPVQFCREHLAAGARDSRDPGQHRQCQRRHRCRRSRPSALDLRGARPALLDCAPEQVLPFSTGVIMETLPHERVEAGCPPRWPPRGPTPGRTPPRRS